MDIELLKTVSEWATVVFTIGLGIPQLIKLFIERKTGKVSFLSFWILHLGISMWILYGALASIERPYGLQNVIIADGVSLLISSATIWFLYYFKEGITKQTLYKVTGGLAAFLIFAITMTTTWATSPQIRFSSNVATIFALIAPVFTTFAFSPQLYVSIKSKNWKGVSPWVFVLFTINNIFWILFWISLIALASKKGDSYTDIIGALIWQTVSFSLYSYQLYATLYYNSKFYESRFNKKQLKEV